MDAIGQNFFLKIYMAKLHHGQNGYSNIFFLKNVHSLIAQLY